MLGVQNAIESYNSAFDADLPSADELFRDWALAIKYDVEGDQVVDIRQRRLR